MVTPDVPEPPLVRATEAGLGEQVRPGVAEVQVRATLPVNPLTDARFSVSLPLVVEVTGTTVV